LGSRGGPKEAQLISEGVNQEKGVGSDLEVEGKGLTEVLFNLLLGCKVERAIKTRELGHAAHRLHILEMMYSSKCVMRLLCS